MDGRRSRVTRLRRGNGGSSRELGTGNVPQVRFYKGVDREGCGAPLSATCSREKRAKEEAVEIRFHIVEDASDSGDEQEEVGR